MNVFSFTGNLGKDAELRHTKDGDPVSGFSVAVKSGFGKNEKTIWVDCSLWGKRAEALAPYLKKGGQVAVSGELQTREYEGKTYIGCKITEITLVGGKSEGGQQSSRTQPSGQPVAPDMDSLDDDIPF